MVRGSSFDLQIIYDFEKEDEIEEDFNAIKEGLQLLQFDYLGGHGSRGYGKIKFSNLDMETVVGELDNDIYNNCRTMLKEV